MTRDIGVVSEGTKRLRACASERPSTAATSSERWSWRVFSNSCRSDPVNGRPGVNAAVICPSFRVDASVSVDLSCEGAEGVWHDPLDWMWLDRRTVGRGNDRQGKVSEDRAPDWDVVCTRRSERHSALSGGARADAVTLPDRRAGNPAVRDRKRKGVHRPAAREGRLSGPEPRR